MAPVARRPVLLAALAQAVVLTAVSGAYGYHRDELYFRMLPPAWGYIDQPLLTPLVARTMAHLHDTVWVLRLPATLASAAAVVLLALVCRRLGGDRRAQALAAWGMAFGFGPLALGHLLLTSTLDIPLLLGVVLLVLEAATGDPRWWVPAGALSGLATFNRLIVVVLVPSLVLGIVLLGPRRSLLSRWAAVGVALGVLGALPQAVYQWRNDWPQLAMGRALSAHNATSVRPAVVPLLLFSLGIVLAVVWVVGVGWLLRDERRARFGFLVVGFAGLVVFTLVGGSQPHYPIHLVVVMYAAGCVPVARWMERHAGRQRLVWTGLAGNALVCIALALPVVPLAHLGGYPPAYISSLTPDQVGWPTYVRQVAAVYGSVDGAARRLPVYASNYGEAGAIARFGPADGLPRPVSAHNALYDSGVPAGSDAAVLLVGGQADQARRLFARCDVLGRLDDGIGVDSEEQDQPIALCRNPTGPWATLWPRLRHLD